MDDFPTCLCDHDFEEHDADLACCADGCVCVLYEEGGDEWAEAGMRVTDDPDDWDFDEETT